ncbi:DUF58 domain-containing protein, partial [Mycobacterium sp. ITM-2017-0098]
MVLTGRTGVIALLCAVPVLFSPYPAITFGVFAALLAAAVVVDTVLAGSPRALRLTRGGPSSARLGQPVTAALTVDNSGRARFRGVVRDAWAPSARARPRTHPVNIPAGQRVTVETELTPVRRGDQVSALVT